MKMRELIKFMRVRPIWQKILIWVFVGLYVFSPIDGIVPVIDDLMLMLVTAYLTIRPPERKQSGN